MSQSGAGELRRSNQKIADRAGDDTRDIGEHAQGGANRIGQHAAELVQQLSLRRDTNQRQCDQHDAANATKAAMARSEEHTSELQSLMRISYAVLCLKQKTNY